VFHALEAVRGLQRGRCDAQETEPVRPVPEELIHGIEPFVSKPVWALIQVQLRTGCRPDEAVRLRGADFVCTEGPVWVVRYDAHKTAHWGIEKKIFFGPRAQQVIAPFLANREPEAYLFSAVESAAEHRAQRSASRRTALSCGNRPGTNRKLRPHLEPQGKFTVDSYRRAIERACDQAFPPPAALDRQRVPGGRSSRLETNSEWQARLGVEGWKALSEWMRAHRWSPNRLRHNAATALRHQFGIDVAQTVLGHRLGSRVTELYAERDLARAQSAIREAG
jgi:integrase